MDKQLVPVRPGVDLTLMGNHITYYSICMGFHGNPLRKPSGDLIKMQIIALGNGLCFDDFMMIYLSNILIFHSYVQ